MVDEASMNPEVPNQVETEVSNEAGEEHKTVRKSKSLGLPVTTAGTLAYGTGFLPYLGWISGLLLVFLEQDKQVRFHAFQAVVIFGVLGVGAVVFNNTALLRGIGSLLYLGQFIVWLVLMYRTYMGDDWMVPYVGEWARKQVQ